jgi:hypothetical protein
LHEAKPQAIVWHTLAMGSGFTTESFDHALYQTVCMILATTQTVFVYPVSSAPVIDHEQVFRVSGITEKNGILTTVLDDPEMIEQIPPTVSCWGSWPKFQRMWYANRRLQPGSDADTDPQLDMHALAVASVLCPIAAYLAVPGTTTPLHTFIRQSALPVLMSPENATPKLGHYEPRLLQHFAP